MSEATVTVLDHLDDTSYDGICRLLGQLTTSWPPPTFDQLAEVVASPSTHLLVAEDGAGLLGTLTLVLVRIPTGLVAHVEDVVVDEAARGRGVGRRLVETAVALARGAGAKHVDLTSRPGREAANRLYQTVGFERRGTNAYRLTLARP